MNFYASSVALLWTTAMRLGRRHDDVDRLAWHSPERLSPRPGAGEQLPGRGLSLSGEFSCRSILRR